MARQERERRYLSQYLLQEWPRGGYQVNVELGPIPAEFVDRYGPKKAAALFRPTRPRVDAVKWTRERYYLIEAKIRDIKAGVGDLMFYRGMVSDTRDLPNYSGQELVLRLVVPWMIDWIGVAAEKNGIEVVIFEVDWMAAYVEERKHYYSPEWRAQRDEKKRLREALGVD